MVNQEEQKVINQHLSREPTQEELAVLSALWSEHCSYKSSKRWFHLFNTSSERVYLGIGEGAGLLDIGDGYVVGLGLESHNHPSAVDPFNGAATGVGGIIRDIVSQGCRPIAVLDCLRFGLPTDARQRLLLDQVVLGISSYGNCVGVPNLGGDLEFSPEFTGNPLVNVMCVGVARKEDIIRSIADTPGDLLLLFGASTGRDGIGGVVFASEELDDERNESRGSVQIGDPLTEKLLIDAVIELRDAHLLHGLQDLGGGGLACAASEMCEKGGTGLELFLDKIPVREKDMGAWELLISESQERMLAVIPPENLDSATQILDRLQLRWAVIGEVKEGGILSSYYRGKEVTNISVDFVVNGFPEPDRSVGKANIQSMADSKLPQGIPLTEVLSSYNIASRRPIYEQYDQHVQGNTVISPGMDAGVVFLPNQKYLAIAAGSNSYLVSKDPLIGSSLATLQIVRSVVARGGLPIGMVDSINAGNPEKRDSYAEFVEMIRGVAEVSHKLHIPVVGGNISLYNESEGNESKKILSTPFIGIVGLIEQDPIPDLLEENSSVFSISLGTATFEGSEFQRLFGVHGSPLSVNYSAENLLGDLIINNSSLFLSCTDVGRGGLLTTLVKWSIQSNVGVKYTGPFNLLDLFGEHNPHFLVQTTDEDTLLTLCKNLGIKVQKIAETIPDKVFRIDDTYPLSYLRKIWEEPLQKSLEV